MNGLRVAQGLVLLIVTLLLSTEVFAGRDFYKILGVRKNADTNTIKKSLQKTGERNAP